MAVSENNSKKKAADDEQKKTNFNKWSYYLAWGAYISVILGTFVKLVRQSETPKKMNTITKDGATIYRLLKEVGFSEKYAQWITAQSAHETANFTSKVYKENYNAFGMKYVFQSTARGEKNGYAVYLTISESVTDYKRLFKSYGSTNLGTVETFVSFLKEKKYFEAPITEYLKGIIHFLNLYFPGGELNKSLSV